MLVVILLVQHSVMNRAAHSGPNTAYSARSYEHQQHTVATVQQHTVIG